MEQEKRLLKPKIDVVFQSLFSKDNLEITKEFAEALLEEKIESITINEDKTLLREHINDKLGILDLELDINNNKKVDVEIQLVSRKDFDKRLIWYFSKLYSKQAKKGEDYSRVKKVVLFAIIDFELEKTKDIKEMETVWKLRETKNHQKILTQEIEIHIIEIKKAREMYKNNKNNKKAWWILFLEDPNSKEVNRIMKNNKGVRDAVVKVMELSEDEKMERLAFLREKAIMDEKAIRAGGYDDGYKEGKEQGIKEKNKQTEKIVRKLKAKNMTTKEISAIVEISTKEVEKILK